MPPLPPPIQNIDNRRIASIDTARFLAIFAIMYSHMSNFGHGGNISNMAYVFLTSGFCNPSALFFIFSGYFAAKNTNWKKALKSSAWCLASYLLWTPLAILVYAVFEPDIRQQCASLDGLFDLTGFHALPFFLADWASAPLNGWYVRDLAVFLLLTPLLTRFAFPLVAVYLAVSLFFDTFGNGMDSRIICSPLATFMFAAGCCLRKIPDGIQHKILNTGSLWFVGPAWLLSLIVLIAPFFQCKLPAMAFGNKHLVASLASMMLMYQTAVIMVRYFPKLGKWASAAAPAVFMTYVSHNLVREWMLSFWSDTNAMALTPVLAFALSYGIYLLLRRTSPFLLHLVAYTKVR